MSKHIFAAPFYSSVNKSEPVVKCDSAIHVGTEMTRKVGESLNEQTTDKRM